MAYTRDHVRLQREVTSRLRRALRRTREALKDAESDRDAANDALLSARQALGTDDGPFVCDAITKVRRERDEALSRAREYAATLEQRSVELFLRGSHAGRTGDGELLERHTLLGPDAGIKCVVGDTRLEWHGEYPFSEFMATLRSYSAAHAARKEPSRG